MFLSPAQLIASELVAGETPIYSTCLVRNLIGAWIDWSFTSSIRDRFSPFDNLGDPFDNLPV
jgi:hypothetical protein